MSDPPASRLTALRQAAGLTQLEWASLLGVHYTTVARWETSNPRHYRPPSLQSQVAAQLAGLWLACASGYIAGLWRCACAPAGEHGKGCPAALMERGILKLTPGAHPRELVEELKRKR